MIDGRYRVGSPLALGATSQVSVGRDERLDRPVAVKVLRGETADRRRFASEARLLASLDHPNLVRLYDAVDDEDLAVLVMELVDGPSLAEVLGAGPLGTAATARVGAELAGCLAYLHARGVVHRDVKPANILIGSDGAARLADFGIARLVDATRLTGTGESIGTPTYMSPEQLTGGAVGPATDVYALGLVLLEARTGRRAFPGTGFEAVAARLARGPDLAAAGLGRGWAGLLGAMTDPDPSRRPPAAAVASILRDERLDSTAPLAAVPPLPAPRHRRAGATWAAAVAASAVLAAGLAAATAAARHGTGHPPRPPAPAAATTAPPPSAPTTATPTTPVTVAARPAPPRPPDHRHGHGAYRGDG